MRSAVGKSCLPTTAKPHSGETTVEGSSGTRRTSDPVETGLRRARTRTKARAPQTGREVPGLPERRRDRQIPAGPRARSRWRGPDGKARRRGCWRTRDAPASLKEGWTRGRSQDGGRARRARGGQDGDRDGSSESRPFGNVEKADALRSSSLLQNAGGPPTQYLFTFGALAWGTASA